MNTSDDHKHERIKFNIMTQKNFDLTAIRNAFPALIDAEKNQTVYLDNAATSQTLDAAIKSMNDFYCQTHSNVHRGSHKLTNTLTDQYESARQTVADFIHTSSENIIWTRGTTEGINLVAYSFAQPLLKAGDEILISEMEHHANIVPWQLVAQLTDAKIVKIPVNAEGEMDYDKFLQALSPKTKIVAVCHVSNVLGVRNPIEEIIQKAHDYGAFVLVDGAQGIVHEDVYIEKLGADFYVFSAHKIYAQTGIGVLYAKREHIDAMNPWQGGGKMIEKVTFEKTHFAKGSMKLEAGTPNISGALSLAEAIKWLNNIDRNAAKLHVQHLENLLFSGIKNIQGSTILGKKSGSGIVSFVVDDAHHSDIAVLLDQQEIMVRSGHHCAHPLMDALNIRGCIRVSIGIYNTESDITKCINAIKKTCELL